MGLSRARAAALSVLDATLSGRATLDRAFERAAAREDLTGPDRGFARLLVAVTLRRLGEIDAVIAPFLRRPLPKKALTASNILRLGAAQLLFLNTPAHAAVGETTGLARGQAASYKGLANAVLRRIAEGGPALADPSKAARRNTPGWLWESWAKAYGADVAGRIADAHMVEPPLDLTVRDGADARWAAALGGEALPTGGVRLVATGRPTDLAGYGDGAWWPQDAAAALPARLFGPVAGKSIVDLCAAPGGKSAQLAAAGARVTAVDIAEPRMRRLAENMRRLKLDVTAVVADSLEWRPDMPADGVLLDAPCSATGTIRRHPDVAWSKSTAAVRALLPIQSELLDAAAEMLKPGGVLVYACCSLQPAEGPEQIARFLERKADFARKPIGPDEVSGLPEDALTSDGDLRTLPCHWAERGGMDGFYVARLIRA